MLFCNTKILLFSEQERRSKGQISMNTFQELTSSRREPLMAASSNNNEGQLPRQSNSTKTGDFSHARIRFQFSAQGVPSDRMGLAKGIISKHHPHNVSSRVWCRFNDLTQHNITSTPLCLCLKGGFRKWERETKAKYHVLASRLSHTRGVLFPLGHFLWTIEAESLITSIQPSCCLDYGLCIPASSDNDFARAIQNFHVGNGKCTGS